MTSLIERLRGIEKQLNECLIEAPYLSEAADALEEKDREIARLSRENRLMRDWLYANGVDTNIIGKKQ